MNSNSVIKNRKHVLSILMIVMFILVNMSTAYAANSKSLWKAEEAYKNNLYDVAVQYFENYLKESKSAVETDVLLKLADSYWQMREYDKASDIYDKISTENSSNITLAERVRISNLEARMKDYEKAAFWLNDQAGYEERMSSYVDRTQIDKLSADSIDWKVEPLNINTNYREFSPVVYDNSFLFSSNRAVKTVTKANGWDGDNYTKLWVVDKNNLGSLFNDENETLSSKVSSRKAVRRSSHKANKKLSPKNLAGIFEDSDAKPVASKSSKNTSSWTGNIPAENIKIASLVEGQQAQKYNVAVASVDKAGNVFFSANEPESKGKKELKIALYNGKIENNAIKDIKQISVPGLDSYNVMHPAVNSEGTEVVFSSNTGEEGTYDLYRMSRENSSANWGTPEKLSKEINTVGNEVFPLISNDGYLYFSSDGRAGYGGLDIYKVNLSDTSAKPELLGYPVNSSSDDFGFYTDNAGKTGYFTSDREVENDNIFSFEYAPHQKSSLITGIIKDTKSSQPIPNATVFLLNRITNEVIVDKTDDNGVYTFNVDNAGDYTIAAIDQNQKEGCMPMSLVSDDLKNPIFNSPDLFVKNEESKTWILKNLLYDFDKWNIRKDAEAPLDSLISILKQYPDLKVELGSHTDSRGSFTYNDRLSQRRAESAVNYIVKKGGISPERITAKVYGEHQLLNKCADGVRCSEYDHQQNRRTEIKIIKDVVPTTGLNPDNYQKGQKLTVGDFPQGYFDKCK